MKQHFKTFTTILLTILCTACATGAENQSGLVFAETPVKLTESTLRHYGRYSANHPYRL